MTDIPDPIVLPCGCRLVCEIDSNSRKTTVLRPCHMECRNVRLALEYADENDRTVEFREVP